MKDMLTIFENHNSPIIEEILRERLAAVLEKFDKTKLLTLQKEDPDSESKEDEKIAASKTLKNTLARIIQRFKPQVLAFLKKYGKLGKTDFGTLLLRNIHQKMDVSRPL
jgi:LmbE family N-acetylglucosaminyl deacetylase